VQKARVLLLKNDKEMSLEIINKAILIGNNSGVKTESAEMLLEEIQQL